MQLSQATGMKQISDKGLNEMDGALKQKEQINRKDWKNRANSIKLKYLLPRSLKRKRDGLHTRLFKLFFPVYAVSKKHDRNGLRTEFLATNDIFSHRVLARFARKPETTRSKYLSSTMAIVFNTISVVFVIYTEAKTAELCTRI